VARHGREPCGPWPVQLRFPTGLTSSEYVSRQAWRNATLDRCPVHPRGGCRFGRNGTYPRVRPAGARVARWYCPEGHQTFSLLPDCLAARLSGSLCEVERVVVTVEEAKSLEATADRLRPDIELPGAVRWTRRRIQAVHGTLSTVRGLMPERLKGCAPTVGAFRRHLDTDAVLVTLRSLTAPHLPALPPPLGFCPRHQGAAPPPSTDQHETGPDPPPDPR
jgi:hypothetical protein